MPIINFTCECKQVTKKFFRDVKNIPSFFKCSCGKEAKRSLSGPAMQSLVVVDNGVQAKAVSVDLKMIEAIEENSTKNFTKD